MDLLLDSFDLLICYSILISYFNTVRFNFPVLLICLDIFGKTPLFFFKKCLWYSYGEGLLPSTFIFVSTYHFDLDYIKFKTNF